MAKILGVVIKPGVPQALEIFQLVQTRFPALRYVVESSGHTAPEKRLPGTESIEPSDFEKHIDLVLVLGGDGTFIHAAALLQNRVVPIVGVNMGRIGFLAEIFSDELLEVLPKALENALPYSDRMRLQAQVFVSGKKVMDGYVLNDAVVALQSLARVADYKIRIGDKVVTTLRGDGVIVSTPTGSTAYSMAAGGSIIAPELEAIGITPICPHQLTQRPFVVPKENEVCITLDSDRTAYATLDGQAGHALQLGDYVLLKQAPVPTRILRLPSRSYFDMLRAKLRWGE
jgi:NAD+ kinase